MARPLKRGADYYPHSTKLRNILAVRALRNAYGLEGYAVVNMLFEYLAEQEDFSIALQTERDFKFLAVDIGIDPNKLRQFVKDMCDYELFESENGRLTSKYLSDSLAPLMEKRSRERGYFQEKHQVSNVENTTRKGEERIEKERIDVSSAESADKQTSFFLNGLNESSSVEAPSIIDEIKSWGSKNSAELQGFMARASFINGTHGKCSDELENFVAHYTTVSSPKLKAEFQKNPVGFLQAKFTAWLIKAREIKEEKSGVNTDSKIRSKLQKQFTPNEVKRFTPEEIQRLKEAVNETTFWHWADAMRGKRR
jgi:hypothetical protein